MSASRNVSRTVAAKTESVKREVIGRSYRVSNELRNAALRVLRGSRSGRVYRVPATGKRYRASAPGESPAVRTGTFRRSWGAQSRRENGDGAFRVVASIESNTRVGGYALGEILENGTRIMAPRPYKQATINAALPGIRALMNRGYRV